MSAPQPLTDDELAAIKARAEDAATRTLPSAPLRLARQDVPALLAEIERLRSASECVCLRGPAADGPDEACPRHGRTYREWIERGDLWQQRAADAVAEVERLREERRAIDLMDWPGEAHRLQAALNFAKGTIHDLSATVERLEDERE